MSIRVMKATNAMRLIVALSVSLGIAVIVGCDTNSPSNSNTASNSNTTSNSNTAPVTIQKTMPGKTGTISANPNPIKVCDGSGLGITTLSWDVPGSKRVEVHVGRPDGALLALSGGPGTQATGKWVGPNSVFYLQDTSDELPLTAANTIATVQVNLTTQGCP